MAEALADRFREKLSFWAGLTPLQVPQVCEAQLEAAAREAGFVLLAVPSGSEQDYVPEFTGRLRPMALPAFRMEETEGGYQVDFGHLRLAGPDAWILHNHGGIKPVNAATYFKVQQ